MARFARASSVAALAFVLMAGVLVPAQAQPSGPAPKSLPSVSPLVGLVATDAIGRVVPGPEAGAPRADRSVGVFYLLWNGSNDMREYKNIFDNSVTLAADPQAYLTPGSSAFPPPEHFAYWGQPLYGYYRAEDAWVMRRHLQLLAAADVDYLVVDASNFEIYKPQAVLLMRLVADLQSQGIKAPQLAFMTHTGSREVMDDIYRTFYAPDAPARYPSTWFQWAGPGEELKPLILGVDPSPQVRAMFTVRHAQWPNEPRQATNGWDWISFDRPQRGNVDSSGRLEQMAVSPAQNSGSSAVFSYTAWYGMDAAQPSRSRTYHAGAEDPSFGAVIRGDNFQEEWDHVISRDPRTVLVNEWNEWWAGNWADSPTDPYKFYDAVDARWSRDLEPSAGELGDAYYLQMVSNIRRYKGTYALPAAGAEKSINPRGSFSQWQDVATTYADFAGDTAPRNHAGVGPTTYVDTSGRNDILATKVARDASNVSFYVRTAQPLTRPDGTWMHLYLNTDRNSATGWQGFDRRVVWSSAGQPSLQAYGPTGWVSVAPIGGAYVGTELMVSIPRARLGVAAGEVRLDFKWWDNPQRADLLDAYVSGDAAPDGRFAYRYDSTAAGGAVPPAHPAGVPYVAPTGVSRIEDDNILTDYEPYTSPKVSQWLRISDPSSSGGSYSSLDNPGGRSHPYFRSFIRAGFDGTAVRWVAPQGPQGGQAEVFIDGLSVGIVNQYRSEWAPRQTLIALQGLPAGPHEIMVMFLAQAGTAYHDSFESSSSPWQAGTPDVRPWVTDSGSSPQQWYATNGAQVADGSTATAWRSNPSSTPGARWVQLSLGSPRQVSRLYVAPAPGAATIQQYALDARVNGAWRQVAVGGPLTAALTRTFAPVTATDVRLRVLAASGPVAALGEFSLNPPSAPPGPATLTAWELTDGPEGWTAGTGGSWQQSGQLRAGSDGTVVTLESPRPLAIDAARYRSLLLHLANATTARVMRLDLTLRSESGVDRLVTRDVRIDPSSAARPYLVDLSGVAQWQGTLVGMSLSVAASTGSITLDHCRFAPVHAVWSERFEQAADWTTTGAASVVADGKVTLTGQGTASTLSSPTIRGDLTNADLVVVRYRSSVDVEASVSYRTSVSSSSYVGAVPLPLVATSEWRLASARVSGNDWSGILEGIRVNLAAMPAGAIVEIDEVRVERFVVTSLNTTSAWTFDTGTEGWGSPGHIGNFGWTGGALVGTVTGPDSQLYSPNGLWVDLTDKRTVAIRMRVEAAASVGSLYFSTEGAPTFSETNSARIPLVQDLPGFVDYLVDMSALPGWTGALQQLRIDPQEGATSGSFAIDSVRLLDYRVAPVIVEATAGAAPTMPISVAVTTADGTISHHPVTWQMPDPATWGRLGTVHVAGTMTDLGQGLTATVRVGGTLRAWEFTADTQGWGSEFGIAGLRWSQPGVIAGSIWYGDAQFFSEDNLGIPLAGTSRIRIGLKNATAGTTASLYFTTDASGAFSGDKGFTFPVTPQDTGIREYVIDVTAISTWSGTLRQLRFDPVDNVASGDFELDYIRIE